MDWTSRCPTLDADCFGATLSFCLSILPADRTATCMLQSGRRSPPASGLHPAFAAGDPAPQPGGPLRRPWIEQPYGEEEITLLEEEVLPAIEQCLLRVGELDQRLLGQREPRGQLQLRGA
jgi:hypothetical protein